MGFPGNGDVNGDPTNLLTPSVNNVSVSALKRNDNGSQLIQVGGNVEHGDSGGPVLDTAGRIVGIVSFGGSDVQGITAFLRSSDSALTLLNGAHIDQTPGAFQKLWQQAFADYVDTTPGHWHTASREMDDLSARYPDFHGADVYRAYADTAAIHESTSSSSAQLPIAAAPVADHGGHRRGRRVAAAAAHHHRQRAQTCATARETAGCAGSTARLAVRWAAAGI